MDESRNARVEQRLTSLEDRVRALESPRVRVVIEPGGVTAEEVAAVLRRWMGR